MADRPGSWPIGRPNAVALLGELERLLERDLHRADRAERHQQPLPLEVGHDQVEAARSPRRAGSPRARRRPRRRAQRRVGRVPAHLLELRGDSTPSPVVDDQERDAVVAALLRRLDRGDDEVRAHAVGDERLRAVDDPAAVDLLGVRLDAGDVGAGVGLGDPERARSSRP